MTYKLTLTHDERRAIDWVGNRYSHGTELYCALWLGSKCQEHEAQPSDGDLNIGWDDERELTFIIPEHVAWTIQKIVETDGLACFSPELCHKLHSFCGKVV